jgi:hypothetical protein
MDECTERKQGLELEIATGKQVAISKKFAMNLQYKVTALRTKSLAYATL